MQKGPRIVRARPVAAASRLPMGGKPARTMTALDGNGEHPRTRNKRAGRTRSREVGERHKAEQELMDKIRDCA